MRAHRKKKQPNFHIQSPVVCMRAPTRKSFDTQNENIYETILIFGKQEYTISTLLFSHKQYFKAQGSVPCFCRSPPSTCRMCVFACSAARWDRVWCRAQTSPGQALWVAAHSLSSIPSLFFTPQNSNNNTWPQLNVILLKHRICTADGEEIRATIGEKCT